MSQRPLVIAHRGASADAAENSLAAFDRAIALGSDMIEFDVRRTANGELIVFHDGEVAGASTGALTRKEIARRGGVLPPLLDEVLDLARGRIRLDVELKEAGYVEPVARRLRERFEPEELLVTSFVDEAVREAKRLIPGIATGLLLGRLRPRPYLRTRLREVFPVARARACATDYLGPNLKLERYGVLGRAHAAGLPCLVWTVNDEATLRRYLADGRVAGVITDDPARALALRDEG